MIKSISLMNSTNIFLKMEFYIKVHVPILPNKTGWLKERIDIF